MQQSPDLDFNKHGVKAELARRMGLSRSAISAWFAEGGRVPAERALQIERLTGVPRSRLRPDLWPEDEAQR